MSRRRELDQRLRKLGEIGEIMRSMKNLALMETRKLTRFLEAQEQSVRLLEATAEDFLNFHPDLGAKHPFSSQAILVLGSERGFCGDFNEELLVALEAQAASASMILAVGSKLCARLESHPALAEKFDGPAIAEDVPKTLNPLIQAIGRLQENRKCQGLIVLHHRSGMVDIARKSLLPPFIKNLQAESEQHYPPLLNLTPTNFYAELVHHYLFAALYEIFYTSLMAENQRRIQHLEGAIQRLDDKNEDLARKSRTLRQNEITEEIEVILLSVDGNVDR